MTPVKITSHPHADHIVVRVAGQLDTTNYTLLSRILDVNLAAGLPLIVDLGETTFLDSKSLSILLAAHARATAAGGEFHLADLNLKITRIMDVTGVLAFLNVHADVQQATDRIRAARRPAEHDSAA